MTSNDPTRAPVDQPALTDEEREAQAQITDQGGAYLPVCQPCINGEGSECHTPGCAFWLQDVPRSGANGYMALDLAARDADLRERLADPALVEAVAEAMWRHIVIGVRGATTSWPDAARTMKGAWRYEAERLLAVVTAALSGEAGR